MSSPRSCLREVQKQLTGDTIVERALGLFTSNGYVAATRVAFYADYPSRTELMMDFMARVNAVLDRSSGLGRPSTAAELVDIVRSGELAGILD